MSELVSVTGADFSGRAEHQDAAIRAWLTGNADHLAIDAVEKLLAGVHAEAERLRVTEAVVDLRQLEFMSSSCFKVFVNWISNIVELECERRYKVQFVSNPKLHWQKRSLHSLRCFASDVISITEAQP